MNRQHGPFLRPVPQVLEQMAEAARLDAAITRKPEVLGYAP